MLRLEKGTPAMLHVDTAIAGLEWDASKKVDLDVVAIPLGPDGTCQEKNLCYYNFPRTLNGAVQLSGDNRSGEDVDGDYDEMITINLHRLPDNIRSVVVAVAIHGAAKLKQTFEDVNSAYIDILNGATLEIIAHYNLSKDMKKGTGVIVGKFDRSTNGFVFTAIGEEVKGGLQGVLGRYGL